ncbi:VOC family protein [Gluconacetobacter takamatsuzukensis]|uniref:2-oxoadipate dioxygenase/decarboxylase n=2 Tax=Gluconacetobacter takamatsuzukensis TaxID=1286190 RepID=A0A7W4KEM7_9PROT|nr:VOC family protein [Gluconacetobacter takamatsuzukensis]MBB2205499.1 VOC family protein [Gluconacetobacter takamatsuzukensis]
MISADEIRARFARAMSDMYRQEVPQYGTLTDLVARINAQVLQADPALRARLAATGALDRLDVERHGAIRLGTAAELATMRRLFAVMGMAPVGYYDLSAAGIPVHSTAFRPVDDAALARNPFRVFTSLLRLDLIADTALRAEAERILAARHIFTPGALALIAQAEAEGGLADAQADLFVREALETFRWHREATVSAATYRRLHDAHRLIADVVCFKGPHINHLTPRTLDIDAAQAEMPACGMRAKDVVEGPPRRACPILLRQTSFAALEEPILFRDDAGTGQGGCHTARFGEIEQRGMALTPKGRALYDRLLRTARDDGPADQPYATRLQRAFTRFPDSEDELRTQGLAYFRYAPAGASLPPGLSADAPIDDLVRAGAAVATPITYEDFLPVSAAGIFRSNLGGGGGADYAANADRAGFEAALGAAVQDECTLYAAIQDQSIAATRHALHGAASA